MKKINYCIILFIGAGLLACSSYSVQDHNYKLIAVKGSSTENDKLGKLIKPYSDSLAIEMNQVIAYADTSFIPERPCGNLNNWYASAVLVNQTKTVRLATPAICLLNFGGIRATINKGDVKMGDIFKIAPFDNMVVWVKMPVSVLPEIANYLMKSGGEPIAGAILEDGQLKIPGLTEETKEIIIITSDYLANGGDKMYFFQKATDISNTGKLMRDCLIEEAQVQVNLNSDHQSRIILE